MSSKQALCPSCGRHWYTPETSRSGLCHWCEREREGRHARDYTRFEGKAVICVETGVEYASAAEADRAMGLQHGIVSRAARRGWRARGMHWRYKEDI